MTLNKSLTFVGHKLSSALRFQARKPAQAHELRQRFLDDMFLQTGLDLSAALYRQMYVTGRKILYQRQEVLWIAARRAASQFGMEMQ